VKPELVTLVVVMLGAGLAVYFFHYKA